MSARWLVVRKWLHSISAVLHFGGGRTDFILISFNCLELDLCWWLWRTLLSRMMFWNNTLSLYHLNAWTHPISIPFTCTTTISIESYFLMHILFTSVNKSLTFEHSHSYQGTQGVMSQIVGFDSCKYKLEVLGQWTKMVEVPRNVMCSQNSYSTCTMVHHLLEHEHNGCYEEAICAFPHLQLPDRCSFS